MRTRLSEIIYKLIFVLILFATQVTVAQPQAYRKAGDPKWRISFTNSDGPFKSGLCWWHSRLQRAFFYLAEFAPDLPKPDQGGVKKIIRKLKRMQPVVIPGYANVSEFTKENQPLIIGQLAAWQIKDTVLNQAWIDGLRGAAHKNPEALRLHMDELFARFYAARGNEEILFLKLQERGLPAHAALLYHMRPGETSGYEIWLIDSNHPLKFTIFTYRNGDTAITSEAYKKTILNESVPWIEYEGDLDKIERSLNHVNP